MYELLHKLPNDFRLRKLWPQEIRELQENPWHAWIIEIGPKGECSAGHPKAKFRRFFVKNCKKLAVKHSIEKPILLNFVNLSTTLSPRLSEEIYFHL